MQSVVSSYTLTVAMLIPVSGWLADRFGTRRIFIFAVSLFTFNLHLLSVHCYTRSELLPVLNFVTMPGLAGPILGPLLGGWLVTYTTWHWLALDFPDQHSDWLAWHFRTQKIYVLRTQKYMPDFTTPKHRFDFIGFMLFGLSLMLISTGLELFGEQALASYLSLGILLSGFVVLFGYITHARHHTQPLIGLDLFKHAHFQ